jgi:hypothetical protein
MDPFQSLQDQQQILSRPTSLLVIDTSTVQRSPCEMENYRSNASPFGLGWRKSTHESPHTHTSLFPIPMQLVMTTTMPSALTQVAITLLHGCDSMHRWSAWLLSLTQSIVPTRQVIGHDDDRTLHSRIPWGLDCIALTSWWTRLSQSINRFDMDGFSLGTSIGLKGDVQRSMPLMNSLHPLG